MSDITTYDSMNFKCIEEFGGGGSGTDFNTGDGMPHTCWEQGTGSAVNNPGNKFWRRWENSTSDNFFVPADQNH